MMGPVFFEAMLPEWPLGHASRPGWPARAAAARSAR